MKKILFKALAHGTGGLLSIKLLYDFSIYENQESLCAEGNTNTEKLAGVVLLTRHGARTPLFTIKGIEQVEYTMDMLKPYVNANIKLLELNGKDFQLEESKNEKRNAEFKLKGGAGKGQLTNLGEKQMFELGRQIRQRYVNELKFLSPDYDKSEIYIRSSHLRRTINSAKSLLSGLYLNSPIINSNDPFSIHVKDSATDYLFPNSRSCSYLQEFYKENTIYELLENKDYVNFIDKLSAANGQKIDSRIASIQFLDDLAVRIAHDKHVPENILELLNQSHVYSTLEMKTDFKPKIHLFFGQLFNLFKSNILEIINKESNDYKFLYYSAHDTTINGILLGLNLVDDDHKWPPFAANIIIELWKDLDNDSQSDQNSNYFVRLYYCGKLMEIKHGNTNKDLTKCSVKDFIGLLRKHSIDQSKYSELCELKVENSKNF